MSKSTRILRLNLRPTSSAPWLCASCGGRLAFTSRQVSVTSRTPPNREPIPIAPPPKPSKTEIPVLQHLKKPIGQPEVPEPGDNSHYDWRPMREKISDYFDSREAARHYMMPAYRPWTLLRHHRGKTFLATPKLYRADAALYFPNFQGYTLAEPSKYDQDTTAAMRGKFTIVRMCCELWSVEQCDTYTSPKQNPALGTEMARLKDKSLQIVQINIVEERLRAWLVRMYLGWQKKENPESEWGRWFMVTKGVNDYMRRDIHMTNPKVGHVYLLDQDCKIRWAGCGDASNEERESLVRCVKRLVEPHVAAIKGKPAVKNVSKPKKAIET